jgi:nickel/cobalt transporter (NiCoT) family protein
MTQSAADESKASSAGGGIFRTMLTTWTRRDWLQAAGLLGFITLMHVVAFAVLLGVVGPAHYRLGSKVFGVGLGITAYTYGLRHAFDADHIAAIDNTTRKLRGDGKRPKSVGFWFAMGHSTIVAGMAALVAAGAHIVGDLTSDGSAANKTLGIIGTGLTGTFLYLIAFLNLIALVGIIRVFRAMRSGELDEAKLESHLQARGFMARILGRLTRTVTRPGQMFPVGILFGLGFDTATEVALLVLAGSGAASGLPWYAIMVLPLLFASGMSLLDSLDGLFMSVAYDWAFLNPVRKVYYNISITGLSVAVAFLIGSIELVSVLHDNAGWNNPVTNWVSNINLNNVGFAIVGLFVLTWVIAVGYWRLAKVEHRWSTPADEPLANKGQL